MATATIEDLKKLGRKIRLILDKEPELSTPEVAERLANQEILNYQSVTGNNTAALFYGTSPNSDYSFRDLPWKIICPYCGEEAVHISGYDYNCKNCRKIYAERILNHGSLNYRSSTRNTNTVASYGALSDNGSLFKDLPWKIFCPDCGGEAFRLSGYYYNCRNHGKINMQGRL